MALLLIGYWRSQDSPQWPDVETFIDEGWAQEERQLVADYLQRGFVARACMGFSTCRICGCRNGNLELSDGSYIWPEGLTHYVGEHGVRLPEYFTDHVWSAIDALESEQVDDTQWRPVPVT